MRKLRTWFYYFMCALAWIFGWPILLFLEVREHLRKNDMIKDLVIFTCLLLIGIAGLIIICFIPMPHAIGAAIGIVSSVLVLAGGVVLWAILDKASDDDDDDGPHFYGPGGTVI